MTEENSSADLKEQSNSCRENDETSSSSASLASSLSISSDIVNKSNQDDEEDEEEDERSLTFDLNSDEDEQEEDHDDDDILSEYEESCLANNRQMRKQYNAFRKLCISNSPTQSYKTRQPHIIYLGFDVSNREVN